MLYCLLLTDDGLVQTRFFWHLDDVRSLVMGPRGVKKIVPRDDVLDVWEA